MQHDIDFPHECLTISLGSNCNLKCDYCFTQEIKDTYSKVLNEKDFLKYVSSAAKIVSSNCKEKNIPFFVGFQGSGEPLMYFEKLKRTYDLVRNIASSNNQKLFSFITSNGCMENYKYEWIASNFNRVCLSLDGDKRINNQHRCSKGNLSTYDKVVETISLLKACDNNPVIRSTVTQLNVENLVSSVCHIITKLKITEIQVEPVYLVSIIKNLQPFPETFVKNYLKAKEMASSLGGFVYYSGYRENENHSYYCNINKKVLFVTPNGNSTNCLFKENETKDSPFAIGYYNKQADSFVFIDEKIKKLRKTISRHYITCEKCEIVNSCVKGCPDVCVIENNLDYNIESSLRCKINRLLFEQKA